MDSVLRPRDIQTRIRAGESPEDVAAAAQTTLDRIMGFAAPVIAERAYVAEQAQKASVRRRAGHGPVGVLGEAVATRFDNPDSVAWDAWRRDDGRWTLVADYASAGIAQRARFIYDAAGRYVMADDDEARELVGDRATTPAPPATAPTLVLPREAGVAEQEAAAAPTLATEPESIAEPPATTTPDTALRPVLPDVLDYAPTAWLTQPPNKPADVPLWVDVTDGDESLTGDLTETSRAVQALLPPTTGDTDWILTQASERPEPPAATRAAAPATEAPSFDAPTPAPTALAEPAPPTPLPTARIEPVDALFEAPTPVVAPSAATEAEPTKVTARPAKPRRAAVPSWDEIMFGTPQE